MGSKLNPVYSVRFEKKESEEFNFALYDKLRY